MSRLIESTLTGKISNILVESENEKKICPRCGKVYTGYPAISRYDNKTEICSACGEDEAMIQFTGGKLEKPTTAMDAVSFKRNIKESNSNTKSLADKLNAFEKSNKGDAAMDLRRKVSSVYGLGKCKVLFNGPGTSISTEDFLNDYVYGDFPYKDIIDELDDSQMEKLNGIVSKYINESNNLKENCISNVEITCPECGEKFYLEVEAENMDSLSDEFYSMNRSCPNCGHECSDSDVTEEDIHDDFYESDKPEEGKEILNEKGEKDFNVEHADSNKISELEDGSAFTFEGLDASDESLQGLVDFLKEKTTLQTPVTIYTWSGKEFNDKYHLTGNNAYPDDLTFVSIALDSWKELGNLPMLKFQVGARWLDDIVDNNARREGYNESAGYDPTSEELEADEKKFKDKKKKGIEDRIGELKQAIKDGVSDDEKAEMEKEIADLEKQLNECDKTLKEDSYEEPFFESIENALTEAGFDVTRFSDAGVLTKNLGWYVSNSEGEVQLQCNGTYLDECDKKLTEGTPEEIADEFIALIAKGTGLKPEQVAAVVGLLSDYIDDLKDKSFVDGLVDDLKTSLNESVEVATNDGSTVSTSGAASVQSNDGQVTVTTEDTVVVINNEPALPVEDVAIPAEEPSDELVSEVPAEEPIETPTDEIPVEEPAEEVPVEDEVVEESEEIPADEDYGINATVEAKSLTVLKNQGSIYMLEIKETNGNTSYWVCENFNASTNEGDNAEVYTSKEEADKDYFERIGVSSEE